MHLHFKQTAIKEELGFEIIMDSNLPNVIKGDSLKLSQVLKNLLSNAFKFTEKGFIRLKINQSDGNYIASISF